MVGEAMSEPIEQLLDVLLKQKEQEVGALASFDEKAAFFTETAFVSKEARDEFQQEFGQMLKKIIEPLIASEAHLKEKTQLAVEQERHRMARELHDTVTQSLYSITFVAKTALELLGQQKPADEVRKPIEYVADIAQNALTEIREVIYHLAPTVLIDQGLVEALRQHCRLLEDHYGLAILFQTDARLTVHTDQQQALYYTTKEALWNAIKHADATHIEISLGCQDGEIVLAVSDNGVGFDLLEQGQTMGIGLSTMAGRISRLGGNLEIDSEPGQGTRVIARLPQSGQA